MDENLLDQESGEALAKEWEWPVLPAGTVDDDRTHSSGDSK